MVQTSAGVVCRAEMIVMGAVMKGMMKMKTMDPNLTRLNLLWSKATMLIYQRLIMRWPRKVTYHCYLRHLSELRLTLPLQRKHLPVPGTSMAAQQITGKTKVSTSAKNHTTTSETVSATIHSKPTQYLSHHPSLLTLQLTSWNVSSAGAQ